jgi:hypothetical protein
MMWKLAVLVAELTIVWRMRIGSARLVSKEDGSMASSESDWGVAIPLGPRAHQGVTLPRMFIFAFDLRAPRSNDRELRRSS